MSSAPTKLLAPVAAAVLLAVLAPAASAGTLSFGSPLSVPATLDTAEDLNYEGSNIPLPGSIFHMAHDGADTLLWNVVQPQGQTTAPAGGQVTSVSLEGCARQPSGAPAPLTQIHFQDLTPTAEGGAKIVSTSQAFDIPVCGQNGAGGSTVTSYAPSNFCVSQGDWVAFNDEGGFVPNESGPPPYPAGVPYMVIGRRPGATMDSFIRNGGTTNGVSISQSDRSYHDGFASNANEEVMLQSTLATGADASDSCPGGTKSSYKPPPGSSLKPAPALKLTRQTDGINSHRIVAIAIYCHNPAGCRGAMTLSPLAGGKARVLRVSFSIPGGKTSHVPVRVPAALVALTRRRHHRELPVRLVASVGGSAFSQSVTLRIF